MSLIDTAVVGQGSSIELAALGIFLNHIHCLIIIILIKGEQ
jgi:Na+-driven multidrug efflux pump